MDANDRQAGHSSPTAPVMIGGRRLGRATHICAFFHSRTEEYDILLPFTRDGLAAGEHVYHTVDPVRRDDHTNRLKHASMNAADLAQSGQLHITDWTQTHLIDGSFDPTRTLAHFAGVVERAARSGFSRTRFVTHMEWALTGALSADALLEYEARANDAWMHSAEPTSPVICTYDLARFDAALVIDIMRTHPMVIVGRVLYENPFFLPPDEFLRERRARR